MIYGICYTFTLENSKSEFTRQTTEQRVLLVQLNQMRSSKMCSLESHILICIQDFHAKTKSKVTSVNSEKFQIFDFRVIFGKIKQNGESLFSDFWISHKVIYRVNYEIFHTHRKIQRIQPKYYFGIFKNEDFSEFILSMADELWKLVIANLTGSIHS